MTLSYHDVRRWDAEALETAATSIKAGKDKLLGLQDELDLSFGPILWHGDAAGAARDRLRGLRDRAEHVVAEASAVQRALQAASDAVAELKTLVSNTDSLASTYQFSIGADGSITDSATAPAAAADGQRRQVATELAGTVSTILSTANEIDTALAGVLSSAEAGTISDQGATTLADADLTRQTQDGHYKIGDPERPDIHFDDDFEYNSKDSNWRDQLHKLEWMAKLRGAQAIGTLPDGTAMYEHYWDNNGEPKEFDYDKAYREDSGIRGGVDTEIARAAAGAEELIRAGNTNFAMTGDASAAPDGFYPRTENWQKAVGGYQVWSHSNVHVDGNRVTMEVTVEAEDRYNFNTGEHDLGTGAPDNENGRFTEIGWAKPFDVHGELTRTITWELGDPPDAPQPSPPDGDDEPRGRDRDRDRDRGR